MRVGTTAVLESQWINLNARIEALRIHLQGLSFSQCRRGDLKTNILVSPEKLDHLHLNFPEWQKHCYDKKISVERISVTSTLSFYFQMLNNSGSVCDFVGLAGTHTPAANYISHHTREGSNDVTFFLAVETFLLISYQETTSTFFHISFHTGGRAGADFPCHSWWPFHGCRASETRSPQPLAICQVPRILEFCIRGRRNRSRYSNIGGGTLAHILIRVSFTGCNALKKQDDYNKVRDVKSSHVVILNILNYYVSCSSWFVLLCKIKGRVSCIQTEDRSTQELGTSTSISDSRSVHIQSLFTNLKWDVCVCIYFLSTSHAKIHRSDGPHYAHLVVPQSMQPHSLEITPWASVSSKWSDKYILV